MRGEIVMVYIRVDLLLQKEGLALSSAENIYRLKIFPCSWK